MEKKLCIVLLSLVCTVPAVAQTDSLTTYGSYLHADARQVWTATGNAAGLTRDSALINRGYTSAGYSHSGGDYHRVQEGRPTGDFQFLSERYQHVGSRLYGYGRFSYDMQQTDDRAWCDQMRPYDSDPYLSGSNVPGKYEQQSFLINAALATRPLGHFTYGVGIDYGVSDLSRLRDPRSRSKLLDYRLSPAVTYGQGPHTLGLAARYHRRKEKMGSIITVQEDASHLWYYYLSGMENATGMAGGYTAYQREWVEHSFGGELSYGLHTGPLHSLLSLSYDHGREQVLEQYKRQPGRYNTSALAATWQNRLRADRLLHQLDLSADYRSGYADEYKQEQESTTDPETGFISYRYVTLITYPRRYETTALDLRLHYRLHSCPVFSDRVADSQESAYAGATLLYAKRENRHSVPDSHLTRCRLTAQAEGGVALLPRQRLWLEAEAAYSRSTRADLSLANPAADLAQGVLLPDMDYYRARYWHTRVQATWQLPLTIKHTDTRWFVRAYADYLRATGGPHAHTVGLTVGMFN